MIQRRDVVETTLEPGEWYDTDTVMLYAMMALLKEFVEEEVGVDNIVIRLEEELEKTHVEETPGTRKLLERLLAKEKEIKAIYDWWEGYEEKREKVDKMDDRLKARDKLVAEEDEMLHRLINVRGALWT